MLVITGALIGADDARADQPSATVNAGLELLFGRGVTSGGLRVHGAFGRSFGDGHTQPTISGGGTLAFGSISVDDPAAPDVRVHATTFELGPEITFALRFANGGWVDKRVFASAAGVFTHFEHGPRTDALFEDTSTLGVRISVGMNWLDGLLPEPKPAWQGTSKADNASDIVAVLLPHQVELVFERTLDLSRFGVALTWGL